MNKQFQAFLRLFGSSVLRIVIYSCFGAIFGALVTLLGGACVFFALPGIVLSGYPEHSEPLTVIGLPQVGLPIYWVAGNSLFYGAIGFMAGLIDLPIRMTYRSIRNARKIAEGRCTQCGYDLKGNISGTCPECGTQIRSLNGG